MAEPLTIQFIMTDQQRADCLSLVGDHVLQTPAMDRIGFKG
jgi:arylsulfatase A-like enzyme